MTRLPELLDAAVGKVEPSFEVGAVLDRATRRRRARMRRVVVTFGIVASVAVAVAVGLFGVAHSDVHARRLQVENPTPKSPRATAPADVLILDETGGVVTLDISKRIATRRPLDGWRPGDQPFVSRLVGGNLVVGWGDVHATPIAGGPSKLLGNGVFVTAPESGAVWLTSYGAVESPTDRLVDMHGRVIEVGMTPSGTALVGVPGGLVLQSSTGLDIWDAATRRITRHLGSSPGSAAPAYGSLLPWCDRCNRALELTDVSTGATREIPLHLDGGDATGRVEFSPDGSHLAVATTSRPDDSGSGPVTVVVVDAESGMIVDRFDAGGRNASLAWSPDGMRLYVESVGSTNSRELLVRDPTSHMTHDLGPAPPGAGRITAAVSRPRAGGLLDETTPGAAGTCPAPVVSSDNSTRRCSYRF